jgi:hypothetical protein
MAKRETFTRRERQVMDAIHELGEATAKQIQKKLLHPPSYSAVRAVLSPTSNLTRSASCGRPLVEST